MDGSTPVVSEYIAFGYKLILALEFAGSVNSGIFPHILFHNSFFLLKFSFFKHDKYSPKLAKLYHY